MIQKEEENTRHSCHIMGCASFSYKNINGNLYFVNVSLLDTGLGSNTYLYLNLYLNT